MIDAGDCYDIQMISGGDIKPSVLPDIRIDRQKAHEACEQCQHRMCKEKQ